MAAQNNGGTTRLGGITGSGFLPAEPAILAAAPGVSVGACVNLWDHGEAIAEYMLSVMHDESARTADRLEAAKWLADRGFGRSVQTLNPGLDVTAHPPLDVTQLSTPDLEALIAIFERYRSNARELVGSGEIVLTTSAPKRVGVT